MPRDAGGSLDDTMPVGPATLASDSPAGSEPTGFELARQPTKYRLGELIGRGGMGEVIAAHDETIGRDVAIKRMRSAAPSEEATARFLREAKIQARLDHPAIVPVHELGHDAEGRPYFTMKRLAGVTLAHKLTIDPVQRLLRAFADVCLALEFAHARGVIHRDLKPSNIMLGDFGEVYVLDWGLARVLGSNEPEPTRSSVEDLANLSDETQTGDLLGTPGYMAPEQLRDAANAERPADVYSLGVILFEILAGEPLHPRGTAALASTLEDIDGSPARRSERTIAPELDALCIAALASDPGARPTVRDLVIEVQGYLDGDRDLAHRRTLAAQELAAAHMALASNQRAVAMRAAARAMAFDPRAGGAELVTRLMLEPPREAPRQLASALRDAEAETVRRHANSSFFGFLAILAFMPIAIWNGVRDWSVVGPFLVLAGVLAVASWMIRRRPHRTDGEMIVYFFALASLVPLVGRVCGPLILVPGVACLVVWAALMYPALMRHPLLVVGAVVAGYLTPLVLEQLGVLASTWSFGDDTITSRANAIELHGISAIACVFGATLVTIGVSAFHGASLARANLDAQQRLVAQSWHLQQLLPAAPG
jgi:serine/threonine-protein kinase